MLLLLCLWLFALVSCDGSSQAVRAKHLVMSVSEVEDACYFPESPTKCIARHKDGSIWIYEVDLWGSSGKIAAQCQLIAPPPATSATVEKPIVSPEQK